MVVIPFQINTQSYNIFVVLEKDNIRRIRAYDPAQLSIPKLPEKWRELKLDTILIGWATKNEIAELQMCNDEEALGSQLKKLSRGFEFRPDKGDYDGPYRRGMAYEQNEPTVRNKLVASKKILELKLAKINEAIAALDKHPEFEEVHNVLSKALGRF